VQLIGSKECPFAYKFILVTTKGETKFLARTQKEVEMWMRIICRIVDINAGKREPFESEYSLAWENLQAR